MMKSKHTSKKGLGMKLQKDHGKSQTNSGKAKDTKTKGPDTPEEYTITFPELKTVDKKQLSCYTQVLNRTKEEGVGMEDLDKLQLELETLLSAVAVRIRELNNEITTLSTAEERKDKKGKLAITPTVTKKKVEEKSKISKSVKDTVAGKPIISPVSSKARAKGTSTGDVSDMGVAVDHVADTALLETPKVVIPKNDLPNKFWAFIQPYCDEITQEDIKYIQDLIASFEKEIEIQKIPPIGRHYTLRWAEEDLMDERDASSVIKMKRKTSDDVKDMMKRAEKICVRDKTPGPLVQRLVSALLEENIPIPLQETGNKLREKSVGVESEGFENSAKKCKLGTSPDSPTDTKTQGENIVPSYLKKLPLYHTSACFERRVRKELEAAGLLDTHEIPKEENDEILGEIKRCQEELKAIAIHNIEQLKRVLKLAQEEMEKQEIKRKLKQIDAEIIEIYRKTVSAKIKKKPIGKKEREQAWKILKDRENLLKTLEAMQ